MDRRGLPERELAGPVCEFWHRDVYECRCGDVELKPGYVGGDDLGYQAGEYGVHGCVDPELEPGFGAVCLILTGKEGDPGEYMLCHKCSQLVR